MFHDVIFIYTFNIIFSIKIVVLSTYPNEQFELFIKIKETSVRGYQPAQYFHGACELH